MPPRPRLKVFFSRPPELFAKVSHARHFEYYKGSFPQSPLSFERFSKALGMLSGNSLSLSEIKRQTRVDFNTLYQIMRVTGARTPEQVKHVEGEVIGKSKRVEYWFDGKLFESIKQMLADGKLSIADIAAKAGVSRDTISRINQEFGIRGEEAKRRIARSVTGLKKTTAFQTTRDRAVALLQERNPGSNAFKHSLADVIDLTGLTKAQVALLSRTRTARTKEDNFAAVDSRRRRSLSKAGRGPLGNRAIMLLQDPRLGTSDIMANLRSFATANGIRVKGDYALYSILHSARRFLGISRTPKTGGSRLRQLRSEFENFLNGNGRTELYINPLLARLNGSRVFTPLLLRTMLADYLFRHERDLFEVRAACGLTEVEARKIRAWSLAGRTGF